MRNRTKDYSISFFEESLRDAFYVNEGLLNPNLIFISGVIGVYPEGFSIRLKLNKACNNCGTIDLKFKRLSKGKYRIIEMLDIDTPRLLYEDFPELPLKYIARSIQARIQGLVPQWDFRDCNQCKNLTID